MSHQFIYLPFLNGAYSTAPGIKLTANEKSEKDRLIFQIDDNYTQYIENKKQCRNEDINKYYLTHQPVENTIRRVNEYMLHTFVSEHPEVFTLETSRVLLNQITGERIALEQNGLDCKNSCYQSLFDALCTQVQEDVAIVQLVKDEDYLTAIHLSSPNHWSPADKIGRPFDEIHRPVAGMEQTNLHYRKILDTIVQKADLLPALPGG